MPAIRFVTYHGTEVRLSDLARQHGILPQTLAARLARGATVEAAISAPLVTRSEAGRRAYRASHWRED